jgi:hypothetical protein
LEAAAVLADLLAKLPIAFLIATAPRLDTGIALSQFGEVDFVRKELVG